MTIDKQLLKLIDTGTTNPILPNVDNIASKELTLKSLVDAINTLDTSTLKPTEQIAIQKLINQKMDFTDLFKTNQNFKSHSQKLIDNFTYNVTQVQSYSQTRLKDFCLSYESIAATLTGWGKEILKKLDINIDSLINNLTQLLSITNNIEKLVDSILNIKNNLDNLVDEIKTNIVSEINNLEKILKANLSVFLAGVLPNWFDSDCIANTISDVMPNVYDYLRK